MNFQAGPVYLLFCCRLPMKKRGWQHERPGDSEKDGDGDFELSIARSYDFGSSAFIGFWDWASDYFGG